MAATVGEAAAIGAAGGVGGMIRTAAGPEATCALGVVFVGVKGAAGKGRRISNCELPLPLAPFVTPFVGVDVGVCIGGCVGAVDGMTVAVLPPAGPVMIRSSAGTTPPGGATVGINDAPGVVGAAAVGYRALGAVIGVAGPIAIGSGSP